MHNPEKLVKVLASGKVCCHPGNPGGPKPLPCAGAWPVPTEPCPALPSALRRERRALTLTVRHRALQLLQPPWQTLWLVQPWWQTVALKQRKTCAGVICPCTQAEEMYMKVTLQQSKRTRRVERMKKQGRRKHIFSAVTRPSTYSDNECVFIHAYAGFHFWGIS